jgi:hypothetical protein
LDVRYYGDHDDVDHVGREPQGGGGENEASPTVALVALAAPLNFRRRQAPLTAMAAVEEGSEVESSSSSPQGLRRLSLSGGSLPPVTVSYLSDNATVVEGWPILRRTSFAVGLELAKPAQEEVEATSVNSYFRSRSLLFDDDFIVWLEDSMAEDLARRPPAAEAEAGFTSPRCRGPDKGLMDALIKANRRRLSPSRTSLDVHEEEEESALADEDAVASSLRRELASMERKLSAAEEKLRSYPTEPDRLSI